MLVYCICRDSFTLILLGYKCINPSKAYICRCTCGLGAICTCVTADMVEVAEALVEQEAALLEEGPSVRESLVTRVIVCMQLFSHICFMQENMASSVMVRMHNFLNVPLEAVRTATAAGEGGKRRRYKPGCDLCRWRCHSVMCPLWGRRPYCASV